MYSCSLEALTSRSIWCCVFIVLVASCSVHSLEWLVCVWCVVVPIAVLLLSNATILSHIKRTLTLRCLILSPQSSVLIASPTSFFSLCLFLIDECIVVFLVTLCGVDHTSIRFMDIIIGARVVRRLVITSHICLCFKSDLFVTYLLIHTIRNTRRKSRNCVVDVF
jgi:hypothetical protein